MSGANGLLSLSVAAAVVVTIVWCGDVGGENRLLFPLRFRPSRSPAVSHPALPSVVEGVVAACEVVDVGGTVVWMFAELVVTVLGVDVGVVVVAAEGGGTGRGWTGSVPMIAVFAIVVAASMVAVAIRCAPVSIPLLLVTWVVVRVVEVGAAEMEVVATRFPLVLGFDPLLFPSLPLELGLVTVVVEAVVLEEDGTSGLALCGSVSAAMVTMVSSGWSPS